MWRAYIVYSCPKCGYKKQSSEKIYKFDEDDYHYGAFESCRSQHSVLDDMVKSECPHCKVKLEFYGWTE